MNTLFLTSQNNYNYTLRLCCASWGLVETLEKAQVKLEGFGVKLIGQVLMYNF